MNSKKLIILIENYVPGGANKYAEDLINCLSEDYTAIEIWGNKKAINSFSRNRLPAKTLFKEVFIFNQSEKVKNFPRPLRIFFRLLLLPAALVLNFISLLYLKHCSQKETNAKIILCNGGYPASLYLIFTAFLISKRFNPSMSIVSTPSRPNRICSNYFWNLIDKKIVERIGIFAVNSSAIKNELITKCHFPSDSIHIVRNGVADAVINRPEKKNKITIGFISRVETSKGIQELLEAYRLLRTKHSSIELIIAGSGSLQNKIEDAAAADFSIKVLGHVDQAQINEILSQIDIFVLPSYQEGLPYSLIEACMAKCAVIATSVGGIPEIVTSELNGILIPPRDANALKEALSRLIENSDLRAAMAANARNTFLNEFSLEKMKESARSMN